MSLLSVAEAQARILALGSPLPVESVPLVDAVGRFAAADVTSARTQPAADLSAMDGYAIRYAERPGPWTVVGESAAGKGLDRALAPGEAARIFTGAPVPDGADVILVQEEAARDGDHLTMSGEGSGRIGAHIRRTGSDFTTGQPVIRAGQLLSPAAIALAASAGHGRIAVHRRPRITILSTGNELVPAGDPTPGVMLPASNGPMLAAMLAAMPADICDEGIVADDLGLIASAFARVAANADIIVTTGGASVGDHDLVKPALEQAGATLDFWRAAMKPGKPLMAGKLGETIVIGLPGNPVSAYVTALLFLKPLILHLLGSRDPLPHTIAVEMEGSLPATEKRAEYVRGRWIDGKIVPVGSQDSAGLAALAEADALIVRPPHSPAIAISANFAKIEILPIA